MDLVTLEVDGSLANPYAAGAVAVWTTILSAIAIHLARSNRTADHRIAKLVLFGLVLLITKPTQLVIGNVLYWITDQRITSVGFWGGPPIWIAPAASCCLGVLTWLHLRYRRQNPE